MTTKQISSSAQSGATTRVASVDALRGLTILVMIFVNDLAGVQGVPPWMKHVQPPDADGMTFVDVVFPAFLFIVGMSIPFALGGRLQRGEPLSRVWLHILTRTLGLLIIGVFMVNEESMSDRGVLTKPVWTLLMYLGVMLVWGAWPGVSHRPRILSFGLQAVGVVLLAVLAILYRGPGEPGLIEMRPQWWGILGLIGWAYWVACTAYLLLRNHLAGLVGAIALFYCVYIANAAGAFSRLTWITDWVDIGAALGSHAAITVSGAVLGVILTPASGMQTPVARLRWALLFGLGLAAAGWLLHSAHDIHRMFIINKIFATPAWCLWSSAITAWIWMALYWVVDVRRWQKWASPLQSAGQNALVAYILAPILYAVFELVALVLHLPNYYDQLGDGFAVGFWRSVVFALVVTWLADQLRRVGVVLRL
jgi:predicted acyltransferase